MRTFLIGLAILATVAVVFQTLLGGPADEARSPVPPPTPTSPSPTVTPSPTSSPADDAPRSAARAPSIPAAPDPPEEATPETVPLEGPPPEGIEEIVDQVAEVRQLPRATLDTRVVAAADLGAKYAALAFEDLDAEDIEHERRLLVALRLIGPDVDLLGIVDALYREQVLGLYVIGEQILYIGGDDVSLTDNQRVTAAHEVVHGLQDIAFDLEALLDIENREADAAFAVRALVEGDATLLQEMWAARHQTADERARALDELRGRTSPAYEAAPPYVRAALSFPYVEGTRFVAALHEAGGWAAVDAAYAAPPTSTWEILHPEAYLAGEGPVDVAVTGSPGAGWEEALTTTTGVFDLRHMLAPLGAERAGAVLEGWRGGMSKLWRRGEDDAVAVTAAFSAPAHTERACAAVPDWYAAVTTVSEVAPGRRSGDGEVLAWTCTSGEVRIGIAPDAATAEAIAAG